MNEWKKGLHDLLTRVACKDEQAFTQLFEVLHHTAIGMIIAEVGGLNESEAESIYGQAMFKVWRKAGTFEGRNNHPDTDATAWAWLRTTILHTALDTSRGIRRREMAEILESEMIIEGDEIEGQDSSPIDELSAQDVSPQERASDNPAKLTETREGLQEYLASLEDRERLIFTLLAEGRAHGDVAAHLGISASRLSQIVSALREKANRMVLSH
jgi:RNA polymerase sigma factor (sigma-70 family)